MAHLSLSDFALETQKLGPLYRVERRESATTFEDGALFSRGRDYPKQYVNDYAPELLRNHFNWRCTTPSPFISLFKDKHHARGWAAPLIRANKGMVCSLYEINPRRLIDGTIFNASQRVEVYGVDLPFAARSRTEGEYLVLQEIPKEAIEWVEEILDHSTTPFRNSGHKASRRSLAITPAPMIMMRDYAIVSPSLPFTPIFRSGGYPAVHRSLSPAPTLQLDDYRFVIPSIPSTPNFDNPPQLLSFTSSNIRPVHWQWVTMQASDNRYKDQNMGTMAPRRNHDEAIEAAVYDPQLRDRATAKELRDGLAEFDGREEGEI